MQSETFQNLFTRGAAVNLSNRSKWKLTGGDRVRYLNGQVTNDVRRADGCHTIYACVTDAKGRIAGDAMIHSRDEALWLEQAVESRWNIVDRPVDAANVVWR